MQIRNNWIRTYFLNTDPANFVLWAYWRMAKKWLTVQWKVLKKINGCGINGIDMEFME